MNLQLIVILLIVNVAIQANAGYYAYSYGYGKRSGYTNRKGYGYGKRLETNSKLQRLLVGNDARIKVCMLLR